jgi:hypothetical protein
LPLRPKSSVDIGAEPTRLASYSEFWVRLANILLVLVLLWAGDSELPARAGILPACCIIGVPPIPTSTNRIVSYILENARLQGLFPQLGLKYDARSYEDPRSMLRDTGTGSIVAILPWRDFVAALSVEKDVMIIGLIEDAFPYVLVSPNKVADPKGVLAQGLTVRGEMSVDFLAAADLLQKFGVTNLPVVTNEDPLLIGEISKRKLPVVIPVERLAVARRLDWFEVASLTSGAFRTRFPATVVVTTKAWISRDQKTLVNFMRLLQTAMEPSALLSEGLVKHALATGLFNDRDQLRMIVQRRLIEGGLRPPVPDKQLISNALEKDGTWFSFLKKMRVDEVVNTSLVK